jgi:hypothetical protein
VGVADAGGKFNNNAFPATVTGVSGPPASSLEGVSPTLAYYSGTYTEPSQLTGLEALAGAPSQAGSYTVQASFAGTADYTAGSAVANFAITRATPVVRVSAAGGKYSGAAFTATASVAGLDGTAGPSLEGVSP